MRYFKEEDDCLYEDGKKLYTPEVIKMVEMELDRRIYKNIILKSRQNRINYMATQNGKNFFYNLYKKFKGCSINEAVKFLNK